MPDDEPITEPFVEQDGQDGQDGQDEQDEQAERVRWFYSSRVDAEGKVPQGLIARASAQRRSMEKRMAREAPLVAPGGPGSVNWTPLGPSVVAHGQASNNPAVNGRFTALAVGPGGSRMYAGAANGGVWFSNDDGTNWAPLDDYSTSSGFRSGMDADSLSVGAIAVQFMADATKDVLFVGTGEPQSRGEDQPFVDVGGSYFGVGIRYSASGGAAGSWNLEATNLAGHGFFKIVIDPDDSTRVYAATTHGLYQRPIGGSFTTWNQINGTFTKSTAAASDIIIAGTGTNKRYYAAFWGDKVYRSSDGSNWTAISGISGTGRIVLAAGENDPTVIYALDGGNGNLYRLDSGTNGNFQPVTGVPKALFFGNQGNYDIVLAVDPSNVNTVYLGGDLTWDGSWTLSFYKGTITGGPDTYIFPFTNANDLFTDEKGNADSSHVPRDLTWIGTGIHPDIHALAFATNLDGTHNGNIVWVGTDGGLFRSTTGGSKGSFEARNTGMAVLEMTYIAQRADMDAVLFAGCQDNGTLRYWGEQAWYEAPQGDGGGVAFDPNNPYRVMRQYVYASLSMSTDGGTSNNWTQLNFPPKKNSSDRTIIAAQTAAAGNENKNTNFYSPIAVSPHGVNPTLAAFGTNRLWLTSDWGTTWVTLPTGTNPYDQDNPDLKQDVLDSTPIRAIAFQSNSEIVAATQNQVWRFSQSSSGWEMTPIPTTGLPPNHIITALAVDLVGLVFITLGGGGIDHVWYYKGNWQGANLTADGNTLDVPAHSVVIDYPTDILSRILYIGTDVGCWKGIAKENTSTLLFDFTWSLFSQGLPESAITDLVIHGPSRLLRAATHGRGVWEIPLDATSGSNRDIYMRLNYADSGRLQVTDQSGLAARFPWVQMEGPDPTAPGLRLYIGNSADIKIRRGSLTANLPPLSTPPNYLDFAFNIGDSIHPVSHLETADKSGINQVFIQVHNRGLTSVRGDQVWVLLLISSAPHIPDLPNDYASHINKQDSTTTWLVPQYNYWAFADPENPYRNLPGVLDVRTPQVVEYKVDFSSLNVGNMPPYLVAFVTSTFPDEQVQSLDPALFSAALNDKHIAFRHIVLV